MLNLENVKTLAYLGPNGSFAEMAKDKFCEKYNIEVSATAFETIKDVVSYVDDNPETIGVLAIENSVEGTIREAVDSLIETKNSNIRILSECYLPINYCLLSRTTEIYSITGIISPPDEIAKCRNFLKNEMPYNLNIIEAFNSYEAAKNLYNYNLTYASIGTEKTAEIFNLNILKRNINDENISQTRFILFGDYETQETGNDKTSIMFATENKPGALWNILSILMKNDINISYIASQPSKNNFGEYILTVSFDGHIHNPVIFKTLAEIKEKSIYMKFLGSYKKSKPLILQANSL